jgi:hypothetical protein
MSDAAARLELALRSFRRLNAAGRAAFLERIGQAGAAEDVIRVAGGLSLKERARLSEMYFEEMATSHYPMMLEEAARLAQERPGEAADVFRGRLGEAVKARIEADYNAIAELERATLREERDDPTSPALRLEIRGETVHLDGEPVPLDLGPEGQAAMLAYLRKLIDHPGGWVSGQEVGDDYKDTHWERLFPKLPPPLLTLIEAQSPKGRRLTRAAWGR